MSVNYQIGQVVRLSLSVKQSGALTAADNVSLVITDPNNASQTYALADVVVDDVGLYHFDLELTMAGRYRYRWSGTGDTAGADSGFIQVAHSGC